MDPACLSRLQFAAATMFHFLFAPLTLCLSILVKGKVNPAELMEEY